MGVRLLRQPPTVGRTVLRTVTERRRWTGSENEACDRTQIQVPVRLRRVPLIGAADGGVRSPRSLRRRVAARFAIASFWVTGVIGVLVWSFTFRDVL